VPVYSVQDVARKLCLDKLAGEQEEPSFDFDFDFSRNPD
jgi:hypothetical protein